MGLDLRHHGGPLLHIGREVPVGQDDPLGIGRGPGGIAYGGGIVLPYAPPDRLELLPVPRQPLVTHGQKPVHLQLIRILRLPVQEDDGLEIGEVLFDGFDLVGLIAGDHDHPAPE